ncbi:MAG: hypothetical protein QOF02_2502 [Blastocatellia bacterium]|jgi:hypothetical protein|nr:hypothetical protein [Blastocatellia bacterium]
MFQKITRITGLFALLLLMGSLSLSFAQSSAQGTMSGTVTDASGAVVAGATVEATNTGTGEKRTATTTDSGSYSIPNLPPGLYSVSTTASGFAASTVKDLKISVSFNTTQDFALNPQGASETVVVSTGDAQTQINTTDQQLSTLLDNKKIIDLPLLNRDPNSLILLAPGTVQTQSGLGGFSVNGSRERNNNFLVDGVDNNDADVPGIAGGISTPNIDATQEFRVITSNFNAEFGRNTGAIINVATKNGTNEYHGNAYIYYRSDRFSARDFFDVSGEADPLQRKQFGTSFGGPIKKDKMFFFFNYEGDRFNFGTQESRVVPSALARTGIIVTPAPDPTRTAAQNESVGRFGTIDIRQGGFNNRTGVRLGIGPNLGLNPAITSLLSLFPLGNDHANDPLPGVFESFRFSYLNRNHTDSTASRFDWRLNNTHTLTVSHNFSTGVFAAGSDTFPGTGDGIRSPQRGQLLTINLVSTLTPSLVNSFTFGGNRSKARFNGAGDQGVSALIPAAINASFAANGIGVAPNIGGTNGRAISLSTSALQDLGTFDTQFRFTGTTVLNDSITYTTGNHTIRGGYEQRWVYSNSATNFGRSETLSFDFTTTFGFPILRGNGGNNITTAGQGGTVQNYAAFLYGLTALQLQSQFFDKNGSRRDSNYSGFRVRESDFFVQDTWRVRPNFTLNYGMRYEFKGVPFEVNGMLSTLVDQNPADREPAGGFVFQVVGKNSGNNQQGLYLNDFNNFAPRFGFAYSPGWENGFISKLTGGPGKMSIRGGYGVFYDRVFGNLFTNARGNPPFQQDVQNIPFNDTFSGTIQEFGRPATQIPSTRVPSNAEIFPVLFALPGNNQFQSKFATPYEQKWNFGFQRELGNQFLFEADYVGAKGTNLLRVIDGQMTSVPRCNAVAAATPGVANDPPCGGPISTSGGSNVVNGRFNDAFFQAAMNLSVGFSTYHSLQTRVTKTLTNSRFGLGQIQGAYTWSHGIDNANDPLVGSAGESTRTNPRDSSGFAGGFGRPERGDSGFDVRHRVVINFLYDIPFKSDNSFMNYLFGNWSTSGIYSFQTAQPFSVFSTIDSAGSGLSQRADFASPGNPNNITPTTLPADPRTTTFDLPRTAFANPCPPGNPACLAAGVVSLVGRVGETSRNGFRGPDFSKTDFSLIKRIPITERYKFTIRADFFNIFNRVNFGVPVTTITATNFGRSTFTIGTPRVIQFAGRFEF